MKYLIALLLFCNSVNAGVIILPSKNPEAPSDTYPVPFVQMQVDLSPPPFDDLTLSVPHTGMAYAELRLIPFGGSADVMLNAKTLSGEEMTSIFGIPAEGLWVSALGTENDTLTSFSMKSIYGQLAFIEGLSVAVPTAIPVTEPHGRSLLALGFGMAIMLFRSATKTA